MHPKRHVYVTPVANRLIFLENYCYYTAGFVRRSWRKSTSTVHRKPLKCLVRTLSVFASLEQFHILCDILSCRLPCSTDTFKNLLHLRTWYLNRVASFPKCTFCLDQILIGFILLLVDSVIIILWAALLILLLLLFIDHFSDIKNKYM